MSTVQLQGDVVIKKKKVESAAAFIQKLRKKKQESVKGEDAKEAVKSYQEEDVKGLKVGHELDDLELDTEQEKILILKDKGVLEEEEDDELYNVQIAERESLQKSQKNKTTKKGYNPYEEMENEFEQEKSLLSQYDEDSKKKSKGFFIGVEKPKENVSIAEKLNKSLISLDDVGMKEASDYMTQDEVKGFKKSKKKKATRKRTDEGEDNNEMEDIQEQELAPRILEGNYLDDEDLQLEIAKSRQSLMKKRKIESVEEFAKNVISESQSAPTQKDEGGIVLSSSLEFVRTLEKSKAKLEKKEAVPKIVKEEKTETNPVVNKDISVTVEEHVSDEEMKDAKTEEGHESDDGLKLEEPLVANGLAATLAMLESKGVLKSTDMKGSEDSKTDNSREAWSKERQALEKLKKDLKGATNKRENYEKYKEKDKELEKRMIDKLKDYKPNIELRYHDDYGNELTPKDAFKQICYKFHGQTPGKRKTDKLLRKLEEQKKLKEMSSSDTPFQTSSTFQSAQKALGTAHVPLVSGNKVVLPKPLEAIVQSKPSKTKKITK